MKKLIFGLLAVVLVAGVVLSTGVVAAPPWAGKGGAALRAEGQLRPPAPPIRLGVLVAALTPELAEKLRVDYQEGVVVVRVMPGSPAAEAGLERGDIITAANGSPVVTPADLKGIVQEAGDQVTLGVAGKGEMTVDLSQGFVPGKARALSYPWPGPRPGLWPLGPLGTELRGIPAGERFSHIMGVEVRFTDKDGVAHTLRLIPGTVTAVSGDSLTLRTNEGNEETFTVSAEVKGHQLLERLQEGQQVVVTTVDGSVRAISPAHPLWGGHPRLPLKFRGSDQG